MFLREYGGERIVALLREHRDMGEGILGDGQFTGEIHEAIHPLGVDPECAR